MNTPKSTYEATVEFLYAQLPMYQRVGSVAFKKGLGNTLALCNFLGNPQQQFKSVHVAGTNGKGSTSHTLAAILQLAGYKVGLYTSPHLKSFTERIRVNGVPISEDAVVAFVEKTKPIIAEIKPSFFELTVGMAFDYFAQNQVDYAVIEVGLGGRLDSTNVILPEICVITNISFDHQDLLGDTLPAIASEKAGIIKHGVPVVISEYQTEVAQVFEEKAAIEQAPIVFASKNFQIDERVEPFNVYFQGEPYLQGLHSPLKGAHQRRNLAGIIQTAHLMKLPKEAISQGISQVTALTGLLGRWQQLGEKPWVFCDVGHNEDGIKTVLEQLKNMEFAQLHVVWGMASDKKRGKILEMMPKDAHYYFCKPNVPRGFDAELLRMEALEYGLHGKACGSVSEAIAQAKLGASPSDCIFIGGSTFVVAEV